MSQYHLHFIIFGCGIVVVSSSVNHLIVLLVLCLRTKQNIVCNLVYASIFSHTFAADYRKLSSIHELDIFQDQDPLLGCSPVNARQIEQQTGTIGGFPVQLLVQVTKLSKSLMIKREKIDELKTMNAKAEKHSSYHEPLSIEFQKRSVCLN